MGSPNVARTQEPGAGQAWAGSRALTSYRQGRATGAARRLGIAAAPSGRDAALEEDPASFMGSRAPNLRSPAAVKAAGRPGAGDYFRVDVSRSGACGESAVRSAPRLCSALHGAAWCRLSSEENRAAPRPSAQLSCFLITSAGQERQRLPEPRPVPVCLFTPESSLGLLGTPQLAAAAGRPSYSAETRPAPRLPVLRLVCFLSSSAGQERTEPARTKVVRATLS
ncbi:hypothetical protein R6Z07M_017306 [Ovis aries]